MNKKINWGEVIRGAELESPTRLSKNDCHAALRYLARSLDNNEENKYAMAVLYRFLFYRQDKDLNPYLKWLWNEGRNLSTKSLPLFRFIFTQRVNGELFAISGSPSGLILLAPLDKINSERADKGQRLLSEGAFYNLQGDQVKGDYRIPNIKGTLEQEETIVEENIAKEWLNDKKTNSGFFDFNGSSYSFELMEKLFKKSGVTNLLKSANNYLIITYSDGCKGYLVPQKDENDETNK